MVPLDSIFGHPWSFGGAIQQPWGLNLWRIEPNSHDERRLASPATRRPLVPDGAGKFDDFWKSNRFPNVRFGPPFFADGTDCVPSTDGEVNDRRY